MKRLLLLIVFALTIFTTKSQDLSFSCPKDTILGCNATCLTLKPQFPDVRGLGTDYTFKEVTAASSCRPYADPGGPGPSTSLSIDDKYSAVINLPFPFTFYGTVYNSLVVSTNGYISFDNTLAGNFSHYGILDGGGFLSANAGDPPVNLPNTLYDKALIMGPYHDLNPFYTTSPTQQIKYNVVGNAPNRKWVLSFYKVPLYLDPDCMSLIDNTHEIAIYESTGVVEVYIKDMQICTGWNEGRAMIGMQDETKTKGIMAPGRHASDPAWGSIGMNETWRFIPTAGAPLYRKVELLDNTGAVIATGDTTRLDANTFEASFPNICPPTGASLYVVKTTYQKLDDPTPGATVYSLDTINVIKQATLPITATMTSSTCGLSTGTITITVAGGVGPYTYTLDSGTPQSSNVFTNLPAGNHTYFAQDAGGCNNTGSITVGNISSLTSTAIPIPTSCPGINNGSITVTPTAGTAPYSFVLDGGTPQATGVFLNLAPGSHTIDFIDANACTGTVTTSVATGSSIQANDVTFGTTCLGQNNGSTTITPTNGTGPYTFSIDGGTTTQPTGVFTGLASGFYTIDITDANGCTGDYFIFVDDGDGISSDVLGTTPTSCPGVNNGTVTINVLNGTGPYTFSVDGGTYLPGNPITGLPGGIHNITIMDATGCTGTTSVAISIGIGNTGTITGTTPASCPGINDGTITATAGTGTAPFSYSLDAGPGQITGNFSGVSAGSHTVVIKDANGCIVTLPVTVTGGPGVIGTAITTNTSCPTVNDGTITVTPGGIPPYTYTLNPGGIVQPNNPVFTGLAPNTYTITFTTGSGCIGTVPPQTILAGPYLTSTVTTFDPPCSNINNGSITVIPGPATTLPVITWTLLGVPVSGPTFSNLPAGSYLYGFTDSKGCTGTGGPITLTTHSPIGIAMTAKAEPLCNGNSNGVITLVASGGVSPYEYALSPFATYQSTGVFNTLAANTYTFRIKDNVGCTKDTTITLGEPTLLTASASNPSVASCAGNDGTIVVIGSGGTPAYQYSIDGVNFQGISNAFIAPAVGPYPNIKVKDANGCIANTSTTVAYVDAMVLTLGNDTTICVGKSVTFQPQTNTGTSIYDWRPLDPLVTLPSTIDNPAIKNATATPTDTATYILHAQWGPCFREDTIIVNILHKPIAYAGLDTPICNNTYAILRGNATNLSGTVNYSWAPPDSVQNPTAAVSIATPVSTQLYTLTVTDNYGCNFSVTDDVLITVQPPVPAFAGNDTLAAKGLPHQLFGSGGVDYLWSPSAPLDNATAQNPLATLNNDQLFVLKVTDYAGCIGYDTVFIQVYEGPNYYVPNAFSPNGDGINDYFRVVPVGMAKTEYFRIFNRYGQLMFETNQWLKGWDGRYKGKLQPAGVYVWIVKGTNKYGGVVEEKGTVIIVQ